ncbi:type IV conjugative transfer system coupling protein TraD [Francisellaceae bacterium]|nr:type IV conjugative transfer system coupling protein TraD [Francisellaceae bacterium]
MSKKNLSKKDTQADFTRGGQITMSNLRMLAQVSGTVTKIGLFIFIGLVSLGIWIFVNKELFWSVVEYCKAYFYVLFNHGSKIIPSYFDGTWGQEYASVMVTDSWYIQNNHTFWYILLGVSAVASILSVCATYYVSQWFRHKGKEESSDKFIRGMELVKPMELTKVLKQNNALSTTKIDHYRVMVKDFGVYQTLIDGTIGTGKSVLLMKFLKDIRAKGDRVIVYDKGCSLTPFFYREDQDHILNPFDLRSELWNVWADGEEITDYQNIADALIPLHGQSDPFWVEAARSIFVSTAFRMKAEKGQSTYRLLSMLLTSTIEDVASYLEGTDAATLVSTKAQKTAISIKSILATYVKSLRFLAEMEEEQEKEGKANRPVFSIRDWVQGETDHKGSWLFLTSNTRQHASMRPLISVWLTIASLALLEMTPNKDRRIWFVVDEMPSLHAIPNLPETLAEVRKFGGCWIIGIQSYAQLRKTYGSDYAETIFDLMNSRFFFRSPSAPMADISSKELGEQEVDVMKTQYSIGANTIRDGVSLGSQTMTKRVVSSAEIMQLNNLECYLRVPGDYPITKLKLAIDKTLLPEVEGYIRRKDDSKKSERMKMLELVIGDAMYGHLKDLDKPDLKLVNGDFKYAADEDFKVAESEFLDHQTKVNAFKGEPPETNQQKARRQLQAKQVALAKAESEETEDVEESESEENEISTPQDGNSKLANDGMIKKSVLSSKDVKAYKKEAEIIVEESTNEIGF